MFPAPTIATFSTAFMTWTNSKPFMNHALSRFVAKC
jgi:hypothetical protein